MKKMLSIVLAVMFVAGMSAPVFAAEKHAAKTAKYNVTRGQVVSIDATVKTLVVKEEISGKEKTFTINEKIASEDLKVGERVKVKSVPGSNVAESVVIQKSEAKKK